MSEPARLVLDTNVCLELLVFRDARCEPLRAALAQRRCRAVTDAACRAEWQRVLRYPLLRLDAERCQALEAEYDALLASAPVREAGGEIPRRLPRCRDPDDQKFLELARAAGAVALLTRDTALLSLARRTARDGLFAIVVPEALPLDLLRPDPG